MIATFIIANSIEQSDQPSWTDIVSAVSNFGSALFALFTLAITFAALYYAKKEYSLHKKQTKADTLSRYNERYSTDDNIKETVKELMLVPDGDQIQTPSLEKDRTPIIFRHEMFLRFFEELQNAIDKDALDKEEVCYAFSYYAIVANSCGKDFVPDYEGTSWQQFKRFVKAMKKIAKKNNWFPELFNQKK
jgi:hypothetical protein